MNSIINIYRKYGVITLLRSIFYPITLMFTMPVSLIRTLWESRILMDGKWSQYNGFRVANSINCLFYRTQMMNIDYYGRGGVSPHIGLGNYNLSHWYHHSLVSLYIYSALGAVLPLLSLFFWLLLHLIWLNTSISPYSFVILIMVLFSTGFYANAFILQNYNALGWAFFPVGIWGWMTGNYWVSLLAWLATSYSSITVVFIAAILSLTFSIKTSSPYPLITLIPACLNFLTNFVWQKNSDGTILESISKKLKAIGLHRTNTKYKRTPSKINIMILYYLSIYSIFGVSWFYTYSEVPVIWVVCIVVYYLNQTFIRFADDQSMQMMMLSISTAMMFQYFDPIMLFPYWLVISPIPIFISLNKKGGDPDKVQRFSPFNIQPIVDAVDTFFKNVGKNERVFMAFSNPKGKYEKLFDGYRILKEIPSYVATKNRFHFFPDWYSVFSLNYIGAPTLWGKNIEEVNKNVKYWNVDYVIIYQNSGTVLSGEWEKSGYKVLATIDWAEFEEELRGESLCESYADTPKWWLLKVPA